jgi:hypothetical protein
LTDFKAGDRVRHYNGTDGGTVVKTIAKQGRYRAMAVVEWDDDSRGTLAQEDLLPLVQDTGYC